MFCLPLVGLVLGLIALWQIPRRGQGGRGMAIAGSVLSGVGVAVWTLLFATGALAALWDGFRDGLRDTTVHSLRVGECFTAPDGMGVWPYASYPAACEEKHHGEVFARIGFPDGPYPGDAELGRRAVAECYAHRYGYVLDVWTVPDHVGIYHFSPSRESWRHGDREIVCAFGDNDPQALLTGSLRRDKSTLNADQIAFLEAERVSEQALDRWPDGEPEDNLTGYRTWAEDLAAALDEETGMLREHSWPAAAARPVADLVADLEEARTAWARAAEAEDADTYDEHYIEAMGLPDPESTITAREALGLSTTSPSYASTTGSTPGPDGTEVWAGREWGESAWVQRSAGVIHHIG
ncbi:DUF4190 domain-containing protein [Streptomyces sp. bgisy022]|uniref:DUF4190 domain-containing protein n=1 Tax=Streptomyces sp. bgisy022 TaxID=3413769 RepID=UPI003D725CA7